MITTTELKPLEKLTLNIRLALCVWAGDVWEAADIFGETACALPFGTTFMVCAPVRMCLHEDARLKLHLKLSRECVCVVCGAIRTHGSCQDGSRASRW